MSLQKLVFYRHYQHRVANMLHARAGCDMCANTRELVPKCAHDAKAKVERIYYVFAVKRGCELLMTLMEEL